MSDQVQAATCQRCGGGFIVTAAYRSLLARRRMRVITPVVCPTCFISVGQLPKQSGRVKSFHHSKGYGFISRSEGEDLIFRRRQIVERGKPEPEVGHRARFHVLSTFKGSEALNVELLQD